MELKLRFFVIFSSILASVYGLDYCYSTDDNPYLGFGSKSPYDVKSTKDINVPSGCNVLYVYGIIRHGTRYPTESDQLKQDELTKLRDQIVSNHETDKRGKLCTQDVQLLKDWKYTWDSSNYGKLATQGRSDMEGHVTRMADKLGDYIKGAAKDKLTLQTSSKSRCQDSAVVFANSMLKTTYQDISGNNIKVNDDLLKYSEDEDTSKKSDYQESEKFKKSSAITNVITQVTERSGYQKALSIEQIIMMYAECKFAKATKIADKAAFCLLFTSDDLKVLEYIDDLETYHKHGYGSSTYKARSCPLTRDLLKKLSELESNASPSQIGSFNFGHSSAVCSILANLGFRKDDEAIKADNFEKYKDSRKWRTSVMDPFASNLYIIVYKCSGELKVSFYNNERYLRLQGADSDLVPYKTVKEKLEAVIKECPATPSGAAGFLVVKEQLVLVICIVFGFLHKFVM